MVTVKVSPKFQIVIPVVMRQSLNLKAGEVLCMLQSGNKLELIPVKTLKGMKGFLKGMDSHIEREEDRL